MCTKNGCPQLKEIQKKIIKHEFIFRVVDMETNEMTHFVSLCFAKRVHLFARFYVSVSMVRQQNLVKKNNSVEK